MVEADFLAREAIRDMLTRYVSYADTGKIDAMLDLFESDAIMEATGDPVCQGREEIRAYFIRAGESIRRHMKSPSLRHHLSSIVVDLIEPDQARTTGYFMAVTEIGPDHWGRYRDTLRYDGERWRIRHRLLQLEGCTPGGWLAAHRAAAHQVATETPATESPATESPATESPSNRATS